MFDETSMMVTDNSQFTSQNNRVTAYQIIGLDAGNRQIKLAVPGRSVQVFASCLKSLTQRDGLPTAPSSQSCRYDGGDNPSLKGSWVIGSLAGDMQGSATFKGEKADVMPEMVIAALSSLGSGVISIGELKLCLPDDVPDVVSQVRSALVGAHHLSTPTGALTLHIKNVAIELEGLSAFKWLRATNFYTAPNRINGVLDIGGGNSSGQLFAPSGYPLLESRKVLPGMGELARMISASSVGLRGIEGKGCSPKLELVLDGIASGEFLYGVTEKSFKGDFDQCFPQWLKNLKDEIRNQWQSYLPQTAEIAIIGGAAPLMYPLVERSKGRFKIAPESAIITAKGMVI